jgi:Flp pilus assembly protein TadG
MIFTNPGYRSDGFLRLRAGRLSRGAGTLSARLRNGARSVVADDRGASIIEFTIVAPVLVLLVLGIGDLGRGFSERFFLQQAANRTLEMAHLGVGDETYRYLVPEAAAAAKVPEGNVTLDSWLECDGTKTDFNGTCAKGQQMARYVKLTIRSKFTPAFTSAGYPNVQPDGSVPISAHASLRIQ